MSDPKCRHCLFYDTCKSRFGCEDFAPVGEEAEEEALNTYIEDRRQEFHEEWMRYVPEEFE